MGTFCFISDRVKPSETQANSIIFFSDDEEKDIDPETETSVKDGSAPSEGISSTSVDKAYNAKGITFEEFMELILFTSDKQPTEEQLYAALKPLEEPKVYESGEIGYLIKGGRILIIFQMTSSSKLCRESSRVSSRLWRFPDR